ncbi:MAG: hypothetical protein P8189_24765 [Anaerolineae bacterium]|jgi:hypothetical protein
MASETVILQLPASLYADLETLATEEQAEPVEVIARLVETARQQRQVKSPTLAFRRILERASDLGISDLAEQHDHYLYGLEKK